MTILRSLIVGALMLAGCASDPGATECKTPSGELTGIICPSGTQCAAAQAVCLTTDCGNAVLDTGEACDHGNIIDGDGCSSTCKIESCGNNVQDPGEFCDDGNVVDGDGPCAADCMSSEICGNDVRNFGEVCDDGNNEDKDGCSATCKSTEVCGNGIKDIAVGEVCDDGNTTSGDGCNSDCRSGEGCRNGVLDPGEECDDGNMVNTDNCTDLCKDAVCGDGLASTTATGGHLEDCDDGVAGVPAETAACNINCTVSECGDSIVNQTDDEECDTGSQTDTATCNSDCTLAVCGDDKVNLVAGEACDPGATGQSAGCDFDCTTPACGDGSINNSFTPVGGTSPEACDDGNTDDGDGCSALCQIESCGNGVTESINGEDCDDGNTDDLDACRNNCQDPSCGDGVHSASETCDTNGNSATCNFDCSSPACGDTIINTAFTPPGGTATESCDDGGTADGDGCSQVCRIETCGNGITEMDNGELCDDGNANDLDGCRNNCQTPRCGDGIESASETCDTNGNTARCDVDCSLPECDDNIQNPAAGEQCEDGNTTSGDGCSSTCRLEPFALTVTRAGGGTGSVTSSPAGINCGTDCSELYLSGTLVTLDATPAANATFAGWSGACSGITTCMVTMDQAQNVTATFDPNRLTVTKSGTGTGTVSGSGIDCGGDCTEDYNVGMMVTLTATPSGDSVFTGWSGGGCSGLGQCTVTLNAATSVDANFTLDTYTLTVNPAGTGTGTVTSVPTGIDCGVDCTESYIAGTAVTLLANPAANSTFTGWSGACSGSGSCVVTMNDAETVTATFTLKQFELSVTSNGDGTVTSTPAGISCDGDCTESYDAGTVVALTATPDANRVFTGWSGACSGIGACNVTMDAAKSVTATFVTNRLTVVRQGDGTGTVSSNPAGINCGNNCTQNYDANTPVTLTAVAASGSRFDGWSGGSCSGTGTCVVTMNSPTTITATFVDLDTLTVTKTGGGSGTVSSSPAGIDCGATCDSEFDDGTTITLTAVASAGSVFTGWSGGGCSGTGTCQVTLNSSTTVTADFETTFTLDVTKAGTGAALGTVQSSPGGIDCGVDCTEDYIDGTNVTLTASTTGGATFTGWTGAPGCAANPVCAVDMTQARNVTATFAAPTFALTVMTAGTGVVTSSPAGVSCGDGNADCSESYTSGTIVTLTATPSGSATGVTWSGGSCSGTMLTCDVTMDMARSVTATFAP